VGWAAGGRMKKVIALLAALLLGGAEAQAQIGISQRLRMEGTTVVVINDTRHDVRVFVNGAVVAVLRPGGEPWRGRFGGGVWPFYSTTYAEISVSAQVCESLGEESVVLSPPRWATDPAFMGALGVPALPDPPPPTISEADLKKSVSEIKAALDHRQVVDRKARKKELDRWLKTAKAVGFRFSVAVCEGPTTETVRVPVTNYGYWNSPRSVAVHVRGPDWNRGGYWLAVSW
jgi:hypothetical protein